ncbi:hypothetical protein O0L34_g13847 [Tuta absoluta]|nr:hypothetical protein O0L34_g13847 [Tuta absoluta]
MKVLIVFALATVALGEVVSPVKVVDLPPLDNGFAEVDGLPSVLGYLVDVAIPAFEARKKAEQAYFAEHARITGGSPTAPGLLPWQAGLITDIIDIDNANGICGASLVSNNRLITAAHCWFDGIHTAWRATVVLGSSFLTMGSDGIRVQTTHIEMHPQWTPQMIRNDVAVLYLPAPVELNIRSIWPVNLPSGSELEDDFVGSVAIASGYGMTGDAHNITSDQFLSHVMVPVIENSVCFRTFLWLVHDTNICIDGAGARSTCKGDSGGPLVVYRGAPILVGVTSFGNPRGCARGSPAAFARITSFMDFFNQHIQYQNWWANRK